MKRSNQANRSACLDEGWVVAANTQVVHEKPISKALQAQLGHTNSKLTLSVYTQPMPAAQRQVASKVADVLHRVLLPVAPKFEGAGDGGEKKKVLIQ